MLRYKSMISFIIIITLQLAIIIVVFLGVEVCHDSETSTKSRNSGNTEIWRMKKIGVCWNSQLVNDFSWPRCRTVSTIIHFFFLEHQCWHDLTMPAPWLWRDDLSELKKFLSARKIIDFFPPGEEAYSDFRVSSCRLDSDSHPSSYWSSKD